MRRSLWLHLVLLAVVLLAGVYPIGADSVVSADESAMLAQLDVLDRSGSWTLVNPEPAVDPGTRALPLPLVDRAEGGVWAPFAKHPVHVTALRPLWGSGGYGATLVLSVLGVVAAAGAGVGLATRMRPGTGPAVVWLVGLGSPLVFDVHQVVGHALGAGLFGLAALLAVRAVDRRHVGWAAAAVVAVALAALVRAEGVLAGLALGAALGVAGLRRRDRARIGVGAAVGVAAVVVRFAEPRLVHVVMGGDALPGIGTPDTADGFLAGRWQSFRLTVLDAGYPGDDAAPVLLVSLLLALAAFAMWRWRREAGLFRVLAAASAAAAVVWLLLADFLVPGLLPAMPLLAVGILAAAGGGRAGLGQPWRAELWATAGLYVAAVVATQYDKGGGGEWGGRYFAIALPLLAALAWVSIADAVDAMDARTRRVGAVTAVVVVGSLAVGAWRATADARDGSADLAAVTIATIDGMEVDVTVATRTAVSRFAWADVLDGRRWFSVEDPAADLEAIGDGLEADGVDRLALVTSDLEEDLANLGSGWHIERVESPRAPFDVALLIR